MQFSGKVGLRPIFPLIAAVSCFHIHMNKTIVHIDFSGIHKPFAKIVDMGTQVICALIARDGEHLTVHRQKDFEELLFTFYSKNKVPSTWDPMKVELATKLGYKDPERHGQYIIHDSSSFRNGLWIDSYHFSRDQVSMKRVLKPIIGLRVDRKDYLEEIPQKYKKLPKFLLPGSEKDFWLSIFFTSNPSDFKMTALQSISTSLGYLAFQISPLDEDSMPLATNQANSAER